MKPIVVKLGGSLLENVSSREQVLRDVAAKWQAGIPVVLVHGGGKHIDAALAQAGIPKRTAGGLRVTDAETLPIVVGVLSGLVNKTLVAELRGLGVSATGISGADASTLVADLHPPIDGVDLGFVGKIKRASGDLIEMLLHCGMLPVVATVASGPGAMLLNVNADAAAAAIAGALSAERLIFLTDVQGLLDTDANVVPRVIASRVASLLNQPHVSGGMRPKLQAAADAVVSGVPEVIIAGPATHSIALAGGKGGTRVVAA